MAVREKRATRFDLFRHWFEVESRLMAKSPAQPPFSLSNMVFYYQLLRRRCYCLNEKVPRRTSFGADVGHAWILEEVSVKHDAWEPFIQYIKFDDPKKQRALRFSYYRISDGKRTKLLGSVYFEFNTIQDLRKKMEETETPAIKSCPERSIWIGQPTDSVLQSAGPLWLCLSC